MTDSNYTHIAVVLDRSGSMNSVRADMQGALDTFFAEQAKLPGKLLVDFHQFDDEYETVFSDVPVQEARAVLEPRGLTALTDAIGKTVTNLGTKLKNKSEGQRPGKVIVAVITDGGENASKEYTAETVKKLVEDQTNKYDWEFIFLGANMDAIATSAGYGFNRNSTITYDTAYAGATVASLSSVVGTARRGGPVNFSDEDRLAAVGS